MERVEFVMIRRKAVPTRLRTIRCLYTTAGRHRPMTASGREGIGTSVVIPKPVCGIDSASV